jgi:hypothetical protein
MATTASFATWVYVPSLLHYFPPLTSFLLNNGSVIRMIGVVEVGNFCAEQQAVDLDVLQPSVDAQRLCHDQGGNELRRSILAHRFLPFADLAHHFTAEATNLQQLDGCKELVLHTTDTVEVNLADIHSVAIVIHADVYNKKYTHINVAGMDNFFVFRFNNVGNFLCANIVCPMPVPTAPVTAIAAATPTDLIWSSIAAIVEQLRHMLGKVSAQQGRFARASERLRVPPIAWAYIRHHTQPPCVVHSVLTTHTRPFVGSGLELVGMRQKAPSELLRFQTHAELAAFMSVFGDTAFVGMRKRCPRHGQQAELFLYDTINVVTSTQEQAVAFRRHITEDGVDLEYDGDKLKIIVRYSAYIVNLLLVKLAPSILVKIEMERVLATSCNP